MNIFNIGKKYIIFFINECIALFNINLHFGTFYSYLYKNFYTYSLQYY